MRFLHFPDRTPPQLPVARSRQSIAKEVAIAFSITVIVIAGLTQLGKLSSLILENTSAVAAALFVFLPIWLLRRDGIAAEDYAIRSHGLRRQILAALLLSAVVLPVYFCGYHAVQTRVADRTMHVDEEIVLRWPQSLEGRPTPLHSTEQFQLWDERGVCTLVWPASTHDDLQAHIVLDTKPSDVRWVRPSTQGLQTHPPERFGLKVTDNQIDIRTRRAGGMRFDTAGARRMTVRLTIGDKEVGRHHIRLGRYGLEADDDSPLEVERGWLWIVLSLLIHIVLVGAPEEIFYRGYVQTRLQLLFSSRWSLLGVRFGPALIVTSILFALGHYLIELDPSRLMVFFPSLLFGWIRNWTNHVAAAAIFHGICNVSVLIIAPMYVG